MPTWTGDLDGRDLPALDRAQVAAALLLQAQGPVYCPICSLLLEHNGHGVRNCPMGHYRWDGEE